MPKRADYLLIHHSWPGEDIWEIDTFDKRIEVEPSSKEWFEWLAAIPSSFSFEYYIYLPPRFKFTTRLYRLTARKERRRERTYWYAYVMRKGKMKKAYLGKTEDLTGGQLNLVATWLDLRE